MKTREVHFAGSAIAIEYQGERAGRLLDYLYRDVPTEGPAEPHIIFRLLPDGTDGILTLSSEDEHVHAGEGEEEIAAFLLDRTCYHLADRSQGGLVIHGAGLAWRGRGLLLPGPSGSGKSTSSAWLVNCGFDYLTDELIFVPNNKLEFHGLTRPLNLKSAAREVLKEILGYEQKPEDIISSRAREMTPPRILNADPVISSAALNLIVFPHFQKDADFELHKISKAQSGMMLMGCLINARNLEGHGFPQVTRLAREVPAYEMAYGNFEQIEENIKALLET